MLTISARDNEYNRWKRMATKTKTERNKKGCAIYIKSVRAEWFYCAFVH